MHVSYYIYTDVYLYISVNARVYVLIDTCLKPKPKTPKTKL